MKWRGWSQLAIDLNRLNYILIPTTKQERERWRTSRAARIARRIFNAFARFTEDGWLLIAFTFIAGLAALDVRRSDAYMVWATLTGLVIASWAWSFFLRLSGVKVDVLLPRRVTVGDETTFTLAARNEGRVDHETLLVRGPFLSWDGSWTARRASLSRLARQSAARVELRARFRERGEHHIDPFRVQALAPFGLALGPALITDAVHFLAVPRVANVASISLPQGRRRQPGGVPHASATADSRELVGVRPYRFGDPVRDLHARTWARIGEPVVREYREEYFSRIGIILDTDLGSSPDSDFEAAISLVAGLVAACSRTEALVDVVVLGNVAHSLTVGRGLGTLDRVLELLACTEPEGPFDPDDLATGIPRLSSLSCLVFVALRWDGARRAFAKDVESRGTTCVPIVITPDDAKRIHAGEPLHL